MAFEFTHVTRWGGCLGRCVSHGVGVGGVDLDQSDAGIVGADEEAVAADVGLDDASDFAASSVFA